MKIKKLVLGLLSVGILLNCSGKLSAARSPSIKDRYTHLVTKCGLCSKSGWPRYVSERKWIIENVLNYFCNNRAFLSSKGRDELWDKVLSCLHYTECTAKAIIKGADVVESYDRLSIGFASNYEEFLYNLAAVYLTYVDISNSKSPWQQDCAYSLSMLGAGVPGPDEDRIHAEIKKRILDAIKIPGYVLHGDC